MKKNIYKAILAAFLMPAVISCSLEQDNPGGLTDENLSTTEAGFNALVTSAYSCLSSQMYGRENIIQCAEGGSDLFETAGGGRSYRQQLMYHTDFNTGAGGIHKDFFPACYESINYCNKAIELGKTLGQSPAKIAEAHFLRGFYYFTMVEHFGPIPSPTTNSEYDEAALSPTRTPVRDIYDQIIIPDLQYAAENLPKIQSSYGRAACKTALGMLAKAALARASEHEAYSGNNKAEREQYATIAYNAALRLLNEHTALGCDLWSDVSDVFKPANNKNNKESIFNVCYNDDASTHRQGNPNRIWTWISHPAIKGVVGMQDNKKVEYMETWSGGIMQPTRYLLGLYDKNDKRWNAYWRTAVKENNAAGYTWTAKDATKYNKNASVVGKKIATGEVAIEFSFTPIDKQTKATANHLIVDINDIYEDAGANAGRVITYYPLVNGVANVNGTPVFGGIDNEVDTKANGGNPFNSLSPSLTKFEPGATLYNLSGYCIADVIVMRLADAYLLGAEAAIILGKDAVPFVAPLRQRAGLSAPTTLTMDDVMQERAIELCGEHTRWYDLKRWNKLDTFVAERNPDILLEKWGCLTPVKVGNVTFKKMYLRPIPISYLNSILNAEEFGTNGY